MNINNASIILVVGVAFRTLANAGVPEIAVRVLEEEGHAFLAVAAAGVVLAIVANSAADSSCLLVDCGVEVAACGMVVALAFWGKYNLRKRNKKQRVSHFCTRWFRGVWLGAREDR
jgi:hypothetical protein